MNTTVRIGTLIPTPSVSVPQITLSRPAWASCSTSRRYFGSMPAWCTPMPCFTSRDRVFPKPGLNRKPPISSAIRSFSSRVQTLMLVSACACSRRGGLGEVHDVHRRLVRGEQLLERLVDRRQRPLVAQRHRAHGTADHGGRAPGASGEIVHEAGDVAERRGHQQELGLRQLDQRHLPGPAAVGLGVEVELVHHHLPDVGGRSLAERDVGEHLGGAADQRRLGVDRGVTGEHADVVGAEHVDQVEELLGHQRLDRRRVERAPSLGKRDQVRAGGDQALSGAGGRGEDHVGAGEDLQQRLLLRRVEAQALLAGPGLERLEQAVRIDPAGADAVEEGHGRPSSPSTRVSAPPVRGTGGADKGCCEGIRRGQSSEPWPPWPLPPSSPPWPPWPLPLSSEPEPLCRGRCRRRGSASPPWSSPGSAWLPWSSPGSAWVPWSSPGSAWVPRSSPGSACVAAVVAGLGVRRRGRPRARRGCRGRRRARDECCDGRGRHRPPRRVRAARTAWPAKAPGAASAVTVSPASP